MELFIIAVLLFFDLVLLIRFALLSAICGMRLSIWQVKSRQGAR